MQIKRKCTAILVVASLWAAVGLAQTDISGEIIVSGTQFRYLNIAVDDFHVKGEFPDRSRQEIADSLRNTIISDLEFSLYFNVVSPDSELLELIASKGEIGLDDWIFLGADHLVTGGISFDSGQITLGLEIDDVLRARTQYRKFLYAEPDDVRRLAHRAADEIVRALTGERSVFTSSIAYVGRHLSNREIFVCDFDGGYNRRITDDRSINLLPAWDAELSGVFYTSYQGGNPDLYYIDLVTGESELISGREGLNSSVAVSPDGKTLALTLSFEGSPDIYLIDRSGRIKKRVTRMPGIETGVTFSPSGDQIAFTSDRTGTPQIYIIDISGHNLRRLTFEGEYNGSPDWSPRGDKIAFVTRIEGWFQIFTIDVTGDNLRQLTFTGNNEDPAFSPDGLHLVFTRGTGAYAEVWVMHFDGSGAARIATGRNPTWSWKK